MDNVKRTYRVHEQYSERFEQDVYYVVDDRGHVWDGPFGRRDRAEDASAELNNTRPTGRTEDSMNMESIIADWLNGGDADDLPWQYHERHYMWRGERVRVLYHWQHGEIARA